MKSDSPLPALIQLDSISSGSGQTSRVEPLRRNRTESAPARDAVARKRFVEAVAAISAQPSAANVLRYLRASEALERARSTSQRPSPEVAS